MRHTTLRSMTRTQRLIALACTIACSAASVHVAVIGVERFGRKTITWSSHAVWWMAPVGYAMVMLGATLVVLVARRLWRSEAADRVFGVLLALLGFLMALVWARGLHPLSILALSAGAAFQTMRWWFAPSRRPGRVLAYAALGMVAVSGAFALRVSHAHRQDAMANAPALEPIASPPNVVVIVMDAVRAEETSFSGYEKPTTPFLDSLAASSTIFQYAFATAPWTLPSHASMFTGRWQYELSANWEFPLADSIPTLAEAFLRSGYTTGGFVANTFYTQRETGLSRGFGHYEDFTVGLRQVLLSTTLGSVQLVRTMVHARSLRQRLRAIPKFDWRLPISLYSERKIGSTVTDEFLRWVTAQQGRPYFAFLNYYDAHQPYLPAPRERVELGPAPTTRDRYDAAIRTIDREIRRLVEALVARGDFDRTIFVVTADHGEQFGEHGLEDHSNSLYRQVLQVPLLVRYPPAVPLGGRVAHQVSIRDLAATVARLAGIKATLSGSPWSWNDVPPSGGWQPVFAGVRTEGPEVDSLAPTRYGPMQSALGTDWHAIVMGNKTLELFQYRRDPAERAELSRDSLSAPTVVRLVELLKANVAADAAVTRRR